jgi:hypothetical protein
VPSRCRRTRKRGAGHGWRRAGHGRRTRERGTRERGSCGPCHRGGARECRRGRPCHRRCRGTGGGRCARSGRCATASWRCGLRTGGQCNDRRHEGSGGPHACGHDQLHASQKQSPQNNTKCAACSYRSTGECSLNRFVVPVHAQDRRCRAAKTKRPAEEPAAAERGVCAAAYGQTMTRGPRRQTP